MLTPIADTERLLSAGVEHSTDNHEACRDTAFAHTQLRKSIPISIIGLRISNRKSTDNKADREQAAEVLARGMAKKGDRPDSDVDAHPFANGETLQS